jgi:hypothetical protein
MDETIEFLGKHLTATIIVSSLALIVAICAFNINRKKYSFDKKDFENKKAKFLLYLENSYRFQKQEDEKFLLFDIRITNFSSTKNSLIPKLKIEYFAENGAKNSVLLEHNPDLFDSNLQNNLTKLMREIRVEEKEIKSGWIIFRFPTHLVKKRIESYHLSLNDSLGNTSSVVCNLIKDIVYEYEE